MERSESAYISYPARKDSTNPDSKLHKKQFQDLNLMEYVLPMDNEPIITKM